MCGIEDFSFLVEVGVEEIGCFLKTFLLDGRGGVLTNLCGNLLQHEFLQDVVEGCFSDELPDVSGELLRASTVSWDAVEDAIYFVSSGSAEDVAEVVLEGGPVCFRVLVFFEKLVDFGVGVDVKFGLEECELVLGRVDVIPRVGAFDSAKPTVDVFLVEGGEFRLPERPDLVRLVAESGADGSFGGNSLLTIPFLAVFAQGIFDSLGRDAFHRLLVDHLCGCEVEWRWRSSWRGSRSRRS